MEKEIKKANSIKRWLILAAGVATMLFAGILYAWSILKAPLAAELGFEASALALNFTLAMCFFCLGCSFFHLFFLRLSFLTSIRKVCQEGLL